MSRKFTNEEIVNMAHLCVKNACDKCPLLRSTKCRYYLARYIVNSTKNEPASAVTDTSSEASTNDTHNLAQLDDSTLLDICQEGLEEITKIYNNDYQVGYANAVIGIVKKLRGGDGK